MSGIQILRRADLQDKLRISKTTFFKWKSEGRLPPARDLNGLAVWRADEVDQWLSQQLSAATEA